MADRGAGAAAAAATAAQMQMCEEPNKVDHLIATKTLNKAIKDDPNNDELYFERSICHYKTGNFISSLDDANVAIRLNPTNYNVFYQKALILIGLSQLPDAVRAFKKAIELRAKQDDSKLSDIFNLLRGAINELNTARRKTVNTNSSINDNHHHQSPQASSSSANNTNNIIIAAHNSPSSLSSSHSTHNNRHQLNAASAALTGNINIVASSGSYLNTSDTVDSTTDRPIPIRDIAKANGNIKFAIISNNGTFAKASTSSRLDASSSRVSSSAVRNVYHSSHPPLDRNIDNSMHDNSMHDNAISSQLIAVHDPSSSYSDPSKQQNSDWNIRRSERIFLHTSQEAGSSSSSQHGSTTNEQMTPILRGYSNQSRATVDNVTGKIVSSKHPQEHNDLASYHHSKQTAKSRVVHNSNTNSEIDVDDSFLNARNQSEADHGRDESNHIANNDQSSSSSRRKRVMIVPSSSTSATHDGNLKEYNVLCRSAKYKRLKRDRERARRGTSKQCTITADDLAQLKASSENFLRVIAPIDGWLYSGQLTFDHSTQKTSNDNNYAQYIVHLDGDKSKSSYLFNEESVLNDVIKEVKINSVSDLRKGARICCYWSRQYKCLSTGVVTSRTFEETKSLVSVKYDNGDLSALPLDDLRLLPPDFPKYMSNCDPLLLAKNEPQPSTSMEIDQNDNVETKLQSSRRSQSSASNNSNIEQRNLNQKREIAAVKRNSINHGDDSVIDDDAKTITTNDEREHEYPNDSNFNDGAASSNCQPILDEDCSSFSNHDKQHDDSENNLILQRPQLQHQNNDVNNETHISASRVHPDEQICGGIDYRPWIFEGEPNKKRKKGRIHLYKNIRRGNEIISVGDSAELMPKDSSILPFIAKIESFWATYRGEMKVRVRWYYRAIETYGEPLNLVDEDNALFETEHFDENDVQSIYRSTLILPWSEYNQNYRGHVNSIGSHAPKIFYLAGYYNPVKRIRQLSDDVKQ